MKNRVLLISLAVVLALSVGLIGCGGGDGNGDGNGAPEGTVLIGGSFGLTGPYAEDCIAVLKAFEDYAAYVNDTHKTSPWGTDTLPEGVILEVKSLDDGCVNTAQALTNYETLKAQGLLVQRISGTGIAQALLDTLAEDEVGATSQASGPYLLTPPRTIFMNYPIYTDQCAAMADWFMENWAGGEAPKVAYLTNNSFGLSLLTPEMDQYLEDIGYDIVGTQILPVVPAPGEAATALTWCRNNNVDLTLGAMICPGSEPVMQEADALSMGPWGMDYTITFGLCSPSHLAVYTRDMGTQGDGLVVAGSYPNWDDDCDGIAFCLDLQDTYGEDVDHIMYAHGLVEAMIQVEAIRLALENTGKQPADLTSHDVLYDGFFQISGLDTGGIIPTTISYSVGDIEGADEVVVHQAQSGVQVELGTWPLRHIYEGA